MCVYTTVRCERQKIKENNRFRFRVRSNINEPLHQVNRRCSLRVSTFSVVPSVPTEHAASTTRPVPSAMIHASTAHLCGVLRASKGTRTWGTKHHFITKPITAAPVLCTNLTINCFAHKYKVPALHIFMWWILSPLANQTWLLYLF